MFLLVFLFILLSFFLHIVDVASLRFLLLLRCSYFDVSDHVVVVTTVTVVAIVSTAVALFAVVVVAVVGAVAVFASAIVVASKLLKSFLLLKTCSRSCHHFNKIA
jgi:hypothetical protein